MSSPRRIAALIPGFHHVRKLKTWFDMRYCRGVYRTFQEAQARIPSSKCGYDSPATSRMYFHRFNTIRASEYAVFYWLRPLLEEPCSLFDFGGNVGLSYYAFQKYLRYADELKWMICDVPEVVKTGRELATERCAKHLAFTTAFDEANGFDVLFTSGALQYLEPDLSELLSGLKHLPQHLLINCVPLSDLPTYYTVQDIGPARCPYKISNRGEFVDSLERIGYKLIDSWQCAEQRACRVLFHPSRTTSPYTGMYLRLDNPNSPMTNGVSHSSARQYESAVPFETSDVK